MNGGGRVESLVNNKKPTQKLRLENIIKKSDKPAGRQRWREGEETGETRRGETVVFFRLLVESLEVKKRERQTDDGGES
jgi:hypothetical protein